jgi:hypothetical protein
MQKKTSVEGLEGMRDLTQQKITAATSDAELQQATRVVEDWEKRGRAPSR